MKHLVLLGLFAALAAAQTNLITPVTIGRKADLSAGGLETIKAANGTDFSSLSDQQLLMSIASNQTVNLQGNVASIGGQLLLLNPADSSTVMANGDSLQLGTASIFTVLTGPLFKMHNASVDQLVMTTSGVIGGRLQIFDNGGNPQADLSSSAIRFPRLGGGGTLVVCTDNSGNLSAGGCSGSGGGSPGTPPTSIQYNCSGSFCGDAKLEWSTPNLLLDGVLQFYSAPATLAMQLSSSTNQLNMINSTGGTVAQFNANISPPSFELIGNVNIGSNVCASVGCSTPVLLVGTAAAGFTGSVVEVMDKFGGVPLNIDINGHFTLNPSVGNFTPVFALTEPGGQSGDIFDLFSIGPGIKLLTVDHNGALVDYLSMAVSTTTGNAFVVMGANGITAFDSNNQFVLTTSVVIGGRIQTFDQTGASLVDIQTNGLIMNRAIVTQGSNATFWTDSRTGSGLNFALYNPIGTDLRIFANSTDLFDFTAGGFFGVGTTAPDQAIKIGSGSYQGNAHLGFQVGGPGGAREWTMGTVYNGSSTASPNFGFVIADQSANVDILTITWQQDYVGIANDNPAGRLDVNGDIVGRAYLKLFQNGVEQGHFVAFGGGFVQIQDAANSRWQSWSDADTAIAIPVTINPPTGSGNPLLGIVAQAGQSGPLFSLNNGFSNYFQVAATGAVSITPIGGGNTTIDISGNITTNGNISTSEAFISSLGSANVTLNSNLVRGNDNGITDWLLTSSAVIGGRLQIFNGSGTLTFDSSQLSTIYLFVDSTGTTHSGNLINAGFFQMSAFASAGNNYVCASSSGVLFISRSC